MKHVGRIVNTRRRVLVAYRTLPGDPNSALCVMTESLPASEHDDLMKLVESAAGQEENELATAMARSYLTDGRQMLQAFHLTGMLRKIPTNEVEMVPDRNNTINLAELNEIIAQQKGVSIEDLAIKPDTSPEQTQAEAAPESAPAPQNDVLDDEDLAKQYRSQADALYKEAAELRRKAEDLVPTKKSKKKEVVAE